MVFGDTVTITADGPWQHLLYKLTGRKWGNLDVENETGCGIVPYTYRPSNLVNAVQWAAGLELLLLIKSPWQVFLSTDHPNGGCFWRYPEIIELLMRADVRKECLKKLPDKIKGKITLPEIDREYTLFEVATAMSAGPARALGLTQKGNLGVGSDADSCIYEHDDNVARMFSHPRYVIKGGEIVLEDGEIREAPQGREFLVKPRLSTRAPTSSCARCLKTATRCRSRTIRSNSSGSSIPSCTTAFRLTSGKLRSSPD